MDTPPPQMPQGQVAPKKGLHPLAWVGIGCGGLLVLAIIAGAFLFGAVKNKIDETMEELAANPQKVVAEQVVKMNPDLEMLFEDDEAGEMTVRNSATGEETTISYKDLAEGKMTVKGADGSITELGSADITSVPAWVPAYPTMTGIPVVPYHQDKAGDIRGLLSFTTSDAPADVIAFYEEEMDGSSQSSSSVNIGGLEQSTKTFRDGKKTLTISAQRNSGDPTQVQASYEARP